VCCHAVQGGVGDKRGEYINEKVIRLSLSNAVCRHCDRSGDWRPFEIHEMRAHRYVGKKGILTCGFKDDLG
jgi:hypothetical protein